MSDSLTMNITFEQYMDGLNEAAKRLPQIIHDWYNIDSDLCSEYLDQLAWMIEAEEQCAWIAMQRNRADELKQLISELSVFYKTMEKL